LTQNDKVLKVVLLFVDLLGVRSKWLVGGREAVDAAFQDFWTLIGSALRSESGQEIAHGLIESDAVAITCTNVDVALRIARRLFRVTFERYRNPSRRYWMRGVVIPQESQTPLRELRPYKPELNMGLMHYSAHLLDAISVEKSGFKGMRLLVSEELIGDDMSSRHRSRVGEGGLFCVKKLRHSGYPGRIAKGYRDYLWMASEDEGERYNYNLIMSNRLRLAAADNEEFVQAAATQVVFHEYSAMVQSIESRVRRIESRRRFLKSRREESESDMEAENGIT
jgi:hypothetical protein